MAAKVAMVAMPAVLGIASIRVYTVNEAPPDGLITREKLNIYTPMTKSAQFQFLHNQPGLVESGLTTAREGLLPFVHAVKGACVSLKRGSVNLYHAGEDVYYYLKDPPPGFLPRFSTITMAGLLGMFLARKGSRLKRIAIPLGLMSAGASVCYPSQAVAVVKVTGKKMYAAGQWSHAVVSSLLTSKSSEPVIVQQPQALPVQPPQAAVVDKPCHASELVSDAEAGSVECVPASDKLIIAITAEKPPVTLTEISAEQVPLETDSEKLLAPPSKESVSPVQNEERQPSKEAPEGALAASEDVSITSDIVIPASDAIPTKTLSSKATIGPDPETGESAQAMPEVPVFRPTSEISEEPAAPVAESKEVPTATAEEELTPEHTTAEQPSVEPNKGDSGCTPDPALLDFGQSNPEDEDLYSTRS